MSMRATFTTEFIYDGSDGYQKRGKDMKDILMVKMELMGGSMIGQIAGITSGLDLSEYDIKEYIDEMVLDLSKVTKVPFKIVWLFEGGDILIKEIVPNAK